MLCKQRFNFSGLFIVTIDSVSELDILCRNHKKTLNDIQYSAIIQQLIVIKNLLDYLWQRKKWWLVLLITISGILVVSPYYKNLRQKINNQKHFVYDCSIKNQECKSRELEYNITNCKYWNPESSSPPECEKTKEGLLDISYITDAANYIPSPITSESFTAELISSDFYGFDLEISSTGELIILDYAGKITYLKNDQSKTYYLPNRNTEITSNSIGYKGLALDPDFTQNRKFYVFNTYAMDEEYNSNNSIANEGHKRNLSKVVSYKLLDEKIVEDKILLDDIPGSVWHNGGRLKFGPDKKLYITTGDANELIKAHDPSFLGGKILRINTDGTVPEDNPFLDNYVFSLGHRNPQGIAWNTKTKEMFNSEHGNFQYDEINKIMPGKNYGWGNFECDKRVDGSQNNELRFESTISPLVCTKTWTMAPSGIEFISDESSPWYKSLFVASLRGEHVHRYMFEGNKTVIDEIFFISTLHMKDTKLEVAPRMRDVEFYNNSLYILSDNGEVIKITSSE